MPQVGRRDRVATTVHDVGRIDAWKRGIERL
jgi:hypothetical protein